VTDTGEEHDWVQTCEWLQDDAAPPWCPRLFRVATARLYKVATARLHCTPCTIFRQHSRNKLVQPMDSESKSIAKSDFRWSTHPVMNRSNRIRSSRESDSACDVATQTQPKPNPNQKPRPNQLPSVSSPIKKAPDKPCVASLQKGVPQATGCHTSYGQPRGKGSHKP
jgi:hypothetical protein